MTMRISFALIFITKKPRMFVCVNIIRRHLRCDRVISRINIKHGWYHVLVFILYYITIQTAVSKFYSEGPK